MQSLIRSLKMHQSLSIGSIVFFFAFRVQTASYLKKKKDCYWRNELVRLAGLYNFWLIVNIDWFAICAPYRRPTPVAIYNINWPEMRRGWLQYLNLNRTDNSTLILNYRQKECSFWSEYMPSVVGFLLPTFRPFTEVSFLTRSISQWLILNIFVFSL